MIKLWLFIICTITYFPTLFSEFKLDDFEYLNKIAVNNYSSLWNLLTQSTNLHYNPLNILFNDFFFSMLGSSPTPYHILNILLFYFSGLLLFKIVKRLTDSDEASFLAAVLFFLHPINAEIVNQICFNTVIISAIFFELSVLWFDKYVISLRSRNLWAALISFVIAALTLETALILPLILWAWCYGFRQKELKKSFELSLPFWGVSLVLFLIWYFVSHGNSVSSGIIPKIEYLNLNPLNFLGSSVYLILWYLQKLIIPIDHIWIYAIQPLDSGMSLICIIFALIFITALIRVCQKDPKPQTSFLLRTWFWSGFLFLLPGMFAHPEAGLVIEPYWFFVSSMGFFVMAGITFNHYFLKYPRSIRLFLICAVCGTLLFYTQRFNEIAKTQKSYSQYWLEISLNQTPLTALAKEAYLNNDYKSAAYYYELYLKKFAFSPYANHPPVEVSTTLAAVYSDMGNLSKAKEMAASAIKMDPSLPGAYIVDGIIAVKENNLSYAEKRFVAASALDLKNTYARYNLVDLYVAQGQYDRAIGVLEELEKMNLSSDERMRIKKKLAALKKLEPI